MHRSSRFYLACYDATHEGLLDFGKKDITHYMWRGPRRWSGFRFLALLVVALGAWGVLRGLPDVLRISPPMMRRLEPGETVQALLRDYPANFGVLAIFVLFMVILCVHFMAVLRDLYRHSPVAALSGGVFLSGSVLFGITLNLTALKVNEFALQAAQGSAQRAAWFTPEQQVWLQDGINFLNQLHLIFVWGWLLCMGLGFLLVGAGVLAAHLPSRLTRVAGGIGLLAGLALVSGVLFELSEPMYAGAPPRHAVFFLRLWELAVAAGFLSSGALGWFLPRESPQGR